MDPANIFTFFELRKSNGWLIPFPSMAKRAALATGWRSRIFEKLESIGNTNAKPPKLVLQNSISPSAHMPTYSFQTFDLCICHCIHIPSNSTSIDGVEKKSRRRIFDVKMNFQWILNLVHFEESIFFFIFSDVKLLKYLWFFVFIRNEKSKGKIPFFWLQVAFQLLERYMVNGK